jgi:hypothetical protein
MLAVFWCNSQGLWQSVWGTRRISSATIKLYVGLGAKPPPEKVGSDRINWQGEMALIWFLMCYGKDIKKVEKNTR